MFNYQKYLLAKKFDPAKSIGELRRMKPGAALNFKEIMEIFLTPILIVGFVMIAVYLLKGSR